MNLIERAAKKLEERNASPLAKTAEFDSAAGEKTMAAAKAAPSDANSTTSQVNQPEPDITRDQEAIDRPTHQLDLDGMREKGFITPNSRRNAKVEEYRRIKRPLLRRAFRADDNQQARNNLIMVTSALPGEGKTYSSINLAMSIAQERDVHVLLIDADLSRAGATKIFGLRGYPGFSDLLENDKTDVGEVLVRTNIGNLSIIPAGAPHELSTELLSSERAERLSGEISNRYSNRIIIFDTSPVLATSESLSLAQHVGQIVFVVEFGKTKEASLNRALDLIGDFENLGFILNKVGTRIGRGLAGKYDGYYYYGSKD